MAQAAPAGPPPPGISTGPAVPRARRCRTAGRMPLRAGQAAFAVGVQHVDRNAVGSRLQQATRQRIAPLAGAVLAADGDPVHPGHVHLVGRCQLQGRAACSLFSAQHHLRAIPDHAVVIGKRGLVPPLPCAQCGRCVRPCAVIGIRAPGASPGSAPSRVSHQCCQWRPQAARASSGSRAERARISRASSMPPCPRRASVLVQASIREPPRCLDQPHRYGNRALQFAGEIEAGCRETAHRIGRCPRPSRVTLEALLRLHGRVLRHAEQPDPWQRGRGDLAGCVERAPDRQLHVRLPAHNQTSPTRRSRAVSRRVPAVARGVRAACGDGGNMACQRPALSACVATAWPAKVADTACPGLAWPQTVIGRSRCRTAWSWNAVQQTRRFAGRHRCGKPRQHHQRRRARTIRTGSSPISGCERKLQRLVVRQRLWRWPFSRRQRSAAD